MFKQWKGVSLQKISCTRQSESKLSLHSFALSLQKISSTSANGEVKEVITSELEKFYKHQPSKTVKTMKRNEVMAIIATSLMLFALCLSASAKDRNGKVINYSTRIDDDNNRKPTVTVCPERPTTPTLGTVF